MASMTTSTTMDSPVVRTAGRGTSYLPVQHLLSLHLLTVRVQLLDIYDGQPAMQVLEETLWT